MKRISFKEIAKGGESTVELHAILGKTCLKYILYVVLYVLYFTCPSITL